MSASAKPTEKLFKSFLAAVLAISLCPLMPADKAQAEEAGDSADAAQLSDEGSGGDADPTEGALAADGSDADSELAGENDGAEDENATGDSDVALQTASDSGTPIVDWTECGTCQWMIDSSGCLIIEPQSGETGELKDWAGSEAPWLKYRSSIVSVTIKKTVIAKTTSRAFYDCESLRSVDLSGLDASRATSMTSMFDGCSSLVSLDLSSLDTSSVTSMYCMFRGCSSLSSLVLSGLDASSVTSMSFMFYGCSSLSSLDLSGLGASSVTDASWMFYGCSSLSSLDLSGLSASKTTSMYCMFRGCSSLSSLSSLDLSGLGASSVTDASWMFYGCSSLASLDLSPLDTSRATNMSFMFSGCSGLVSLDLSSFDTSSVTDMSGMLSDCSSLRSVALGGEFSFSGAKGARQCSLPKLRGYGLTGFWENAETHELYAEDEIPNNVAATYTAQMKGEASKVALSESMFTVDTGSRTYAGSPIEPSVSSASLRQGTDYSVAYGENVNAGEGTILITGAGNYKGQVAYSFRIDPRQVGAPEAAAGLVYSGAEQVGVAPSGDYDVSGGSATGAGSYTATASLKDRRNFVWSASGNSDDIEVAWAIAKANLATSVITGVPARMEETGSQLAPEPIVTFNGKTLVQGVDYALSYGENVSPGKGTVTVTAVENGNFTGSVTVEFDIEKKAVPAPVFTDVDYSDTSWYGDAVSYVASKGLITGYSGTTLFGVGDVLTRAQLATILWRNACPDEYASYDPETAVDTTGIDGSADGMYYTAAANWAVKNGVITGFDREDGSKDFAADDDVSFEQLVTILARLCATSGELSAAGSDLSAFADGYLASDWSRGAFAWAADKGLVQGYDEPAGKYLRPGEPVARERVAVVLMRAFEMGIMK